MTTPDAAPTEAPEMPRRTAVRRRLLDRLDAAGMVRPRAVTADAFAQLRERLVERLAYLDDACLDTLAEVVIRLGAGPLRNVWPAEATVRNLAADLREPPPPEREIVRSWLASVEGPLARQGGWLVELYRHLVRHPLPPGKFVVSKLREEAEDNRRMRARLREKLADSAATPGEVDWLDRYAADERAALAIVAEGEARRTTGVAA